MAVFTRIALRYLAGYLVFRGIMPPDIADMVTHDPEISAAIGVGIAGAVEGAYAAARRFGWAT